MQKQLISRIKILEKDLVLKTQEIINLKEKLSKIERILPKKNIARKVTLNQIFRT